MMQGYTREQLSPPCTPQLGGAVIGGFLHGINTLDRRTAIRRIATKPELNWFGLTRKGSSALRLQSPVAIYRTFKKRRVRGQIRTLKRAQVFPLDPAAENSGPYTRPKTGLTADDPVMGITFILKVRNVRRGKTVAMAGKGGINCETGRFYIWNGGG